MVCPECGFTFAHYAEHTIGSPCCGKYILQGQKFFLNYLFYYFFLFFCFICLFISLKGLLFRCWSLRLLFSHLINSIFSLLFHCFLSFPFPTPQSRVYFLFLAGKFELLEQRKCSSSSCFFFFSMKSIIFRIYAMVVV